MLQYLVLLLLPILTAASTCDVGSYWNGQKCDECLFKDCLCSSKDVCEKVVCSEGKTQGRGRECAKCPKGCRTCYSLLQIAGQHLDHPHLVITHPHRVIYCTLCHPAYELIEYQCHSKAIGVGGWGWIDDGVDSHIQQRLVVPCSSIKDGRCKDCASDAFLNEAHLCERCMDGCKVCVHRGICEQCQDGYHWQIDKLNNRQACRQCNLEGCRTCLTDDGLRCSECSQGYQLRQSGICLPCTRNCLSCDGDGCTQCAERYFVLEQKCFPCIFGCSECTTLDTCKKCTKGYHLIESKCLSCQQLFPNCSKCYDKHCLKCEHSYYLHQNQCHRCSSAIEGLEKCTYKDGSVVPLECQPSKYLLNQQCIPYHHSCQVNNNVDINLSQLLDDLGQCSLCYPQDVLSPITKRCEPCTGKFGLVGCGECTFNQQDFQCSKCIPGYYLVEGKCKTCRYQCQLCDSDSTCSECSAGHYLADQACRPCNDRECLVCDLQGCKQCKDGYFANNGLCHKCSFGCKTCSRDSCTECYEEYFLHEGGYCFSGIDGCAAYKKQDYPRLLQCEICQYNTYLYDGLCQSDKIWQIKKNKTDIETDFIQKLDQHIKEQQKEETFYIQIDELIEEEEIIYSDCPEHGMAFITLTIYLIFLI